MRNSAISLSTISLICIGLGMVCLMLAFMVS